VKRKKYVAIIVFCLVLFVSCNTVEPITKDTVVSVYRRSLMTDTWYKTTLPVTEVSHWMQVYRCVPEWQDQRTSNILTRFGIKYEDKIGSQDGQ
jgi:predicted small secreted protein